MEKKKFTNGLSVIQLEERFEMVAAVAESDRRRETDVRTTIKTN